MNIKCSVPECARGAQKRFAGTHQPGRKGFGVWYCKAHYEQLRLGKPFKAPRKRGLGPYAIAVEDCATIAAYHGYGELAELLRRLNTRKTHSTDAQCDGRLEQAQAGRAKMRYGVTREQVEAQRQTQGGLCALCRKRPATHIDHDHATGQFRGLLCLQCNSALGVLGDNAEGLSRALAYVSSPKADSTSGSAQQRH